MKLSVIVVSYNVRYYLEQCLDSVYRALEGIESEVFVFDNHSHDDTVEELQKKFPLANFIDSNHNLGFAKGNNIAIRQSSGEYVLLLNPDTFVGRETISSAIQFMDEHPKAGGAGVRMHNADGTIAPESRRGLPSPMTSFYKMIGLCKHYPQSKRFGKYYMSYLPWDSPQEIEVISGAFMLLRREALDQVGLLDEDYFMYGEDIDLSTRLIKAGWENWYLPLDILHYKGESTHKTSFRYVHVFYQAMLIYFRKHYGHLSFLITVPIKMAIYGKAFLTLLSMQTTRLKRSLGFFDVYKQNVHFLIVGSHRAVEECRKIAKRKGLDASFCESHFSENPKGHLSFSDKHEYQQLIVVYDVKEYPYEEILRIFEDNKQSNTFIGTYNVKTKTIITPQEILK